jgi:predicted RNase H-like HicB family nuclease
MGATDFGRYYLLEQLGTQRMKIKAIIHPAEEGGYWAEVPALPGCITEGDTLEEVMANLKDAIAGWLDVANSRSVVESADQHVVEIAV